MADVFISYKREDNARIAPLIRLVESAGYSVWWDQGIEPGDEWFARILDELECSRLTLGVWSRASIDARGLFVPNRQNKYYVKIEHDRTKPGRLIPVQLDAGCAALEFSHIQAVSLADWGGDAADWRCAQLLSRMRALLGDPLPASSFQREEFVKRQPAPPLEGRSGAGLKPGDTFRDFFIPGLPESACPEMVVIPPGRFMMGAPTSEEGSSDTERPLHEVRIDYAFALGKYNVTNAERDGLNGRKSWEPRSNHPVTFVSWEDAQAYVALLNSKLGLAGRSDAYRLPSEAEWEYACRAGTTTPFSFGATISAAQANYDRDPKTEAYDDHTTPVGSFPGNAFGLRDMHGNVWEWVEDVWHENYVGAPTDGSAWIAGGDTSRVSRGGSWSNNPQYLRCASRNWRYPTIRNKIIGFRVARTIEDP